jgi:hypothetical protein
VFIARVQILCFDVKNHPIRESISLGQQKRPEKSGLLSTMPLRVQSEGE